MTVLLAVLLRKEKKTKKKKNKKTKKKEFSDLVPKVGVDFFFFTKCLGDAGRRLPRVTCFYISVFIIQHPARGLCSSPVVSTCCLLSMSQDDVLCFFVKMLLI